MRGRRWGRGSLRRAAAMFHESHRGPRLEAQSHQGRRITKERVDPGVDPATSTRVPRSRFRRLGEPETMTIPPALTRLAAIGRTSVTPPAHRASTASCDSVIRSPKSSALSASTWTLVSPNSRISVARNDARRWRDSMRVTRSSGLTILMGTPGNPAPDPRSAIVATSLGKTLRNSKLSRKRCSTIQTGSDDPTSL